MKRGSVIFLFAALIISPAFSSASDLHTGLLHLLNFDGDISDAITGEHCYVLNQETFSAFQSFHALQSRPVLDSTSTESALTQETSFFTDALGVSYTDGIQGNSIEFTNYGYFLACPEWWNNTTSSDFTVTGWFRFHTFGGGDPSSLSRLVTIDDVSSQNGYPTFQYHTFGSYNVPEVNLDGNVISSGIILETEKWYFFAQTYNYENGSYNFLIFADNNPTPLSFTGDITYDYSPPRSVTTVGGSYYDGYAVATMDVDQIAFWDRGMEVEEIKEVYNKGQGIDFSNAMLNHLIYMTYYLEVLILFSTIVVLTVLFIKRFRKGVQ